MTRKLGNPKSTQIKVGVATKFKKVKFDVPKIVAMYKSGKPISQIALAIGYPRNAGNNRVHNLLMKAGLINASLRNKRREKEGA